MPYHYSKLKKNLYNILIISRLFSYKNKGVYSQGLKMIANRQSLPNAMFFNRKFHDRF